jgi:hypothetical protein
VLVISAASPFGVEPSAADCEFMIAPPPVLPPDSPFHVANPPGMVLKDVLPQVCVCANGMDSGVGFVCALKPDANANKTSGRSATRPERAENVNDPFLPRIVLRKRRMIAAAPARSL